MPMNSSISPSYVSCVRSGVIMSTLRSMITKESMISDGVERLIFKEDKLSVWEAEVSEDGG